MFGVRYYHLLMWVFALGMTGCDREAKQPTPAMNVPNVLLITLDTTRADRIGSYGYAAAQTPALDALADSGVLFEEAYCHVPLTLPSHAAILTGTYPATNGVRINGVAMKGTGVRALAEPFKAKGYRTGAFVSALVLAESFGLNRGFDTYDDDLGGWEKSGWEEFERRGDRVCDAALNWLGNSASTPFFAWVHLFDPHHPYAPPEPYRQLHADPYDGEIAFADAQVGRLVAWLQSAKVRDRTLVVVAGDHGEAFGEHGESRHGLFVYDPTMHVPLIISFPQRLPAGRRVAGCVGLVDVFPTILELLGWELPADLEGMSLAAMCEGREKPSRPVYIESEYPRLGFGWAPLRSLVTDRWKYIEAPQPELYERGPDPQELSNVVADHPQVAVRLREQLLARIERMVPRSDGAAAVNPEVLQRLQALGYVASGRRSPPGEEVSSLRDAKDLVGAYTAYSKATELLRENRHGEVVAIMEPLVRQSPESDQFHVTLGEAYLELGRLREAQAAFEAGLRRVPDNPPQLFRLGETLRRQGHLAAAISHFEAALAIMPRFAAAHCGLGDTLEEAGRLPDAMRHYEHAISADPHLGRAHGRLGVAYAKQRQFPKARKYLERYVELEPTSPHALTNLANVLLEGRQTERAIELLRRALAADPQYADAHQSLIKAFIIAGKPKQALQALTEAHRARPQDSGLTLELAWILATAPQRDLRNPPEALRLALEGCQGKTPTAKDLSVLAAAYGANRDFSNAVRIAREALSLATQHGDQGTTQRLQAQLRQYEAALPPVRQ